MDALLAAVPLARALLSLADAKRTGVLCVRSGYRRAEVALRDAAVVSLTGVDGELLGDALLRDGALDASLHGAALAQGEPRGPVGQWLVSVGAASREAVDRALTGQLAQRLAVLLRFFRPTLGFDAGLPEALCSSPVAVAVAPSVLDGLLSLTAGMTHGELAQLSGSGSLRLTRAGAQFVAALRLSGRPMDIEPDGRIAQAPDATRAVLRALGLLVEARVGSNSFSLLLRKQREVRRRASAQVLLDLPPHAAPEQARHALRRLAQKLHPDRFATELPALRVVAGEVMGALSRAEETLRAPSAPRHGVG